MRRHRCEEARGVSTRGLLLQEKGEEDGPDPTFPKPRPTAELWKLAPDQGNQPGKAPLIGPACLVFLA
ncbi:MAG: hypothetical protein DRP85_08355 [Candidatus Makaraimicrobium thalassicum]|nr:MAG: hypothetical protein DRP85_08355 [Candidatus Omnitrophota bacterium]